MREQGFWDNVKLDIVTGCWNWTAGKCEGYGVVSSSALGNKAHRVSWLLHFGEIPKGMVLMHGCDNRACVNPYHLRVGTHAQNIKDMDRKGRRANRKLSHNKIEELRSRAGEPQTKLSKEYGIGQGYISKIMRGIVRTEDKTL